MKLYNEIKLFTRETRFKQNINENQKQNRGPFEKALPIYDDFTTFGKQNFY